MRIASFNVENLFSRARAMNLTEWSDGKGVLEEYSKLNARLQEIVYTASDKEWILESLGRLGIGQTDESRWVILRQNRGRLLRRPQSGGLEVIAGGRNDWVGWVELKREAVNEIALQMTARVVHDLNADVLAAVEAEDRIALVRFEEQLLQPLGAGYRQVMLVDGNDERGIDVGLMTRDGYTIESIVSHVDDSDNGTKIFSRDCPEFKIRVGAGRSILVLVNHLKSKGYGSADSSNAKRLRQARRVREIYDQRLADGIEDIAIVGDLNDTPESAPLAPLVGAGSNLRDISEHAAFQGDGRPGTYANGTASNKIDYLLLSPSLFARVIGGGVLRMGVWGGVNGTLFPHYPEMTRAIHAASDHAAIFADLDL